MNRKFKGKTGWFRYEEKPDMDYAIETILRDDGNTLAVDIAYSTRIIFPLRQTSPDVFEGVAQFGNNSAKATVIVLFGATRAVLIGRWTESRNDFKWWANLVEQE